MRSSLKIFVWTKDAGTIIQKVNKSTETLGTEHQVGLRLDHP
jgi:hypothetical protein